MFPKHYNLYSYFAVKSIIIIAMKKIFALIIALQITIGSSYILKDLVQKLNGYSKKWECGINSKFEDITL